MNQEIKKFLKENGIETHVFAADQLAKEMGSGQSANIALIGFATLIPDSLSPWQNSETPSKKYGNKFRDISLKIFEKGFLKVKNL